MNLKVRLALFVLLIPLFVLGENWPRFRGGTGQGLSTEKGLPSHWSVSENIKWKAAIPGNGWSSPVIWGDRVVVTSTTDSDQSCHVICLDVETGNVSWNTEVFRQKPLRKEGRNSYATPTPVLNDRGVFAVFGNGSIACVDWVGALKWINDDVNFYSRHGLGASPLIVGELLVMPYDGSKRVPEAGQWPKNSPDEKIGWQVPWNRARVMAVNIDTGKVDWKVGRGKSRIAHVSPIVVEIDGAAQILSAAGDVIQGFDPIDGQMIWKVDSQGEGVSPSFAVGDGLMFTSSGFEKTTLRTVRLGGSGDVTATHIAWENRKGVPTESSLLYVSPYLYAVTSGGIVTCYQGKSGEIVWQERIGGKHSSSPVYVDDKIYFLADDGSTTILRPGARFDVLAKNKLDGRFQASMAVSNGRLFLRSDRELFCVGE
ncbi:PQQ-binding-like beta-propeller repeat protein [bacterium]|nr:PQQ-binding-like beta-propeller repeat protein [Verrucomicrobiota bacterium]MDA7632849.1 PQQ-binding-like beta-propeller repeat protein [bacterium]